MNQEQKTFLPGDQLRNDFVKFANEYPHAAMTLIVGLFVGLVEHFAEESGSDKNEEIKIDGLGRRDIIVCGVPANGHET